MTRLMITLSATALTALSLSQPAEAGRMRFGFGLPIGVVHGGHAVGGSSYYEAQRLEAERRAEAAAAARLRARQKAAAAAAATAAAQKRALAIATARAAQQAASAGQIKTAEAAPPTTGSMETPASEPATVTDCKRYFAHVGITVTVPCTE